MNSTTSDPVPPFWLRLGVRGLLVLAAALGLWYYSLGLVWDQQLLDARRRIKQRELESALQSLAWCRWARPMEPRAWLLSAQVARKIGNYEEAALWLDQADLRGARPRLVQLERVLAHAQQGHFRQVEDTLLDLLGSSRTEYSLVAEVLTGEYMRQYRFPDARRILDRWVELDPEPEAFVRRGWVAEHQLDFDRAIADYHQVLASEPARTPVRHQLAEVLLKVRKPAEALAVLEPLDLTRDTMATLLACRCQRDLGQLDRASALLDALGPGEQQKGTVLAERGHLALARSEFARAEQFFREALRTMPRERDLLHALLQSLSRQGKTAEAEAVRGQLQQADADGRRMTELMGQLARDQGNADLRYECASIFLRSGLTEDAMRWFRLTLEVRPGHRQALQDLADCLERTGNTEEAGRVRQRLANLGQGSP